MSPLFFTYYRVSHMGNWKVSPDLGPGCGCKTSSAEYPNISLSWIYQWESDEHRSQVKLGYACGQSFSCGVSLSRTDLQPPLPKNTKISKIFNILSSFVSYSFIYQIQTFFCYIMDSVLVIIKSR